jgi:DNA repair protein RecO (recombination protein O)
MPAQETEAIILRTFPLGEADRLVSFLARSAGRLRGVAAGARRLKNRFGSALEVLAHVRMEYIERETRDLVRIRECELLESFHAAQSDYALATGLAVVSEIAESVLPEREPAEAMFRLVLLTTREIERRKAWGAAVSYFAFWSVKLGGWLPALDRCGRCGNSLGAGPGFCASWSAHLLCENCRRAGMKPVSAGARQLAERYIVQGLDRMEPSAAQDAPAGEVREAALDWLELHMERKLKSRELLERI